MNFSKHLDALRAPWSQESLAARLVALGTLTESGLAALPVLAQLIDDQAEPVIARVWSCMAIQQISRDANGVARAALLRGLTDPQPGLRRSALDALAAIGDTSLIPAIEPYLTDSAVDPQAWFDDDCTVAHAAERALAILRPADTDAPLDGSRSEAE